MVRHDPEHRANDPEWQNILQLDGEDRLQAYVRNLDRLAWVAHSGKPYFVARRQKPDGTTEHYVERTP